MEHIPTFNENKKAEENAYALSPESKAISETGVENIEVPPTKTYSSFWEEVKDAKFSPISEEEVEGFVHDVYFKEPSLSQLSGEEELRLRKLVKQAIESSHNRDELKWVAEREDLVQLTRNDFFIYDGDIPDMLRNYNVDYGYLIAKDSPQVPEEREDGDTPFIELQHFVAKEVGKKGALSLIEKVELLSDPEVWRNITTLPEENKGWGHLTDQGNNHLFHSHSADSQGSSYGFAPDDFCKYISSLKHKLGRNKINMLDVGGGMGLALYEAKLADDEIITTNLTLHEEPVMYPADQIVLCPMERMPAGFENSFDFIVSYAAFKGCLFPDKAMQNIVRALRKGGEAQLQFVVYPLSHYPGQSPQEIVANDDECVKRIKEALKYLGEEQDAGTIKFQFTPEEENVLYGSIEIEKLA